MRPVLHKFTAPLFAWIPDLSAVPARRQIGIGIMVSLLLHVLALAVFGLAASMAPARLAFAAEPPPPREIELTIEPPPEEEIPLPLAPRPLPLENIGGLAVSEAAPENPVFETSENMKAASERPAVGEVPLPSQQGREKTPERPDDQFTTQKSLAGAVAETPPIELSPAMKEPPAPMLADVTPPPPAPAKLPDEPASEPPQKTSIAALPAPEKPREDEITLPTKLPATPSPVTPPKTTPSPPALAMLVPPPARLKPTYQQEQEKNRIEGSISSRGKSAVDAVGTPLGKYRKQTLDAIGSRWTYYVKSKTDVLALGSVQVNFFINSQGRVESLRVQNNTSNQSFAEVCERAIREAEIQPPPAGTVAPLRDGRLEYSINFTLYSFAR